MDSFHVIKDPIHGTMQFTDQEDAWIKPFINHPTYQRLRHIKQLGLGDLVFPGAVHTRFNHSLGCCYVATQIAHKLKLSDAEKQLVMLAALLHDVGHGPFSHAFEDVFCHRSLKHEDWTPMFLSEFKQADFIEHYNTRNPDFPLSDAVFQQCQAMIMHQPNQSPLLSDIVSSQLDADRFDYLLRDSHFCGVNYGVFDFRWVLHCLTRVCTENGERLGITYKGIGAVEQYLNARRLMMRNIYHNQKKYAVEFLLIQFLKQLASCIEAAFPACADTVLGQLLKHANQYNLQFQHAHPTEQDKQRFLIENYPLYKQLTDYDLFLLMRQVIANQPNHPCAHIAKSVYHRHLPKVFPLNKSQYQQAVKILEVYSYPAWQLSLLRMPHLSYIGDTDPILVQYQETVKPLGDMSLMIDALTDKCEETYFLCVERALLATKGVSELVLKITKGSECQQWV